MRGAATLAQYATGAVLVRLADEGARVTLVTLAVDSGRGPGLGGVLIAALMVPHVLAGPAVGVLTDRSRRPQRAIAALALGFGLSLALAAPLLGRAPDVLVVAVLVAGGCCGPALTGALTSHLSGLVPEAQLPRAFGLDSLLYNSAAIGGPAAAAALALIDARVGAYAMAGCAALGALVLAALPTGRRHVRAAHEEPPSVSAGLRAVVAEPVLAVVTFTSTLEMVTLGALPVVAAGVAVSTGRTGLTGVLMTCTAAGSLLGSLAWTVRPQPPERAPLVSMLTLVASGAGFAAAAAVVGRSPASVAAVAVLFALGGFATGPFMGAIFTARQTLSPPAVRAQVFTLSAGLRTTAGAGGALLAAGLSGLPVPAQVLVAGGCSAVGGAVGLAVLRRVTSRAPAAVPEREAVRTSR
ncbi:MFS transporter [Motilibacter rhizosphaerae]|uniref:MFS transporter n=1 Tax=Motilibacter rhizosphaerae TaxID=598652 RepID=A0A4Q7NPL3_9ACTN|nr:MFS transporter [Motilibacter rhizosphaerae]RZS87221.1 MFS transporter [Motilibacter rhizosphaerae]